MRDVVDLRPAIEAAAEALREQYGPDVVAPADSTRIARTVLEAAAPALGITDLSSIPDARVRPPLPQSGGPIETTETIESRYT